jgi:polar amino acid transport system substrate-binding protein
VLNGRFAQEYIAMALPKGRDAGVPYANKFVDDAKSEGLIRATLEGLGVQGVVMAPSKTAP